MKPYLTGLTGALLALLLGSGPHTEPGHVHAAAAAQAPSARITDAESLGQFLKSIGIKDVKVVKGQQSYCLFPHESGGSKLTMKGVAYPDEPVIELFVELKMPANVSASNLLKVLQLTRRYIIFHRPDDNKMVVQYSVFSRDLGNMPKVLDTIHQAAAQTYTALNTATGTIE